MPPPGSLIVSLWRRVALYATLSADLDLFDRPPPATTNLIVFPNSSTSWVAPQPENTNFVSLASECASHAMFRGNLHASPYRNSSPVSFRSRISLTQRARITQPSTCASMSSVAAAADAPGEEFAALASYAVDEFM
jgi:hypothetical protein